MNRAYAFAGGVVVSGIAASSLADCKPVILSAPLPAVVCAGSDAEFRVEVDDPTTASFEWVAVQGDVEYVIGDGWAGLSGAKTSTLRVHDVRPWTSFGAVFCRVSNACGTVATPAATLDLHCACSPDGTPSGTSIDTRVRVLWEGGPNYWLYACSSRLAVMYVVVAGSGLSYEWYRKEPIGASRVVDVDGFISGSSTPRLSFLDVRAQDDGWYFCRVSNSCNSVDSLTNVVRVCPGELTCDNRVDDSDFVIFVAAYDILDCADPAMPSGCPADNDRDGFVDDGDFQRFVSTYNELLCPV